MDSLETYQFAICRRNLSVALLILFILFLFRPVLVHFEHKDISMPDIPIISKENYKEPKVISGIDVSHYQGVINWQDINTDKFDFVFIKATQGQGYLNPKYQFNVDGAKKAKLLTGGYHFFDPTISAIKQAEFYLKKTKGNHKLLPVLDVEITGGLSKPKIIKRVKEWLDFVEKNTGCKPIIYSGYNYWQSYLAQAFADYPLWIAEYASEETLDKRDVNWTFWQKSNSGHIKGVKTSTDLNVFYSSSKGLGSELCKQT